MNGRASLPEQVKCVLVSSAYEAAAEVLCAPTVALVIELGCLTSRHLRLLQIARAMDVEMIGVGLLPGGMSAADFSGVRLVAVEELAESLRRLVDGQAPARSAAGDSLAAAPPPERPDRPPVRLAPAKQPPEGRDESEKSADWQGEPPPPRREDSTTAPSSLLTREELDALLEDQP
ncbi:MAG TPA: hypothetical protein VM098_00550 [Phycisphaerae bacterium]|nr:hypothetical protein [Phycisphaerae bacterium]